MKAALFVVICCFLFNTAFLVLAETEARGLDFSASGVLVETRESAIETNVIASYSFRVWMKDGLYAIEAIAEETPEGREWIGMDAVFDGTSTYYFRRWNTNRTVDSVFQWKGGELVSIQLPEPVRIKNHADLEIKQGLVPPSGSIDEVQVLWLAFAGHLYYSDQGSSTRGGPLTDAPPVLVNPRMETAYERGEDAVGFLRELTYRFSASGIRIPRGGIVLSMERDRQQFSGSLGRNSFTHAFYHVTAWTNVAEVVFPAAFRMEKYGWEMNRTPSQRFVFSGEITTVRAGDAPFVAPRLQPQLRISERRPGVLGFEGSFTYFSQEGQIMSREQLEQDMTFTRAMAARASRQISPDYSRIVILAVFFLLLLMPPMFYVFLVRPK